MTFTGKVGILTLMKEDNPMQIIRDVKDWPASAHGAVMALGNFDGFHKGHQAVIAHARKLSEKAGKPLAVMTFEPHPRRFFERGSQPLRIYPFAQKARLLKDAGVDYLLVLRFNEALSRMNAQDFMAGLLDNALQLSHVVTGYDFAFGHKREGNVERLAAFAQGAGGFTYARVPVCEGDEGIYASRRIRTLLAQGNVEDAATMLGRGYALSGPVVHGQKMARGFGVPTANIRLKPVFWPRFGVYVVRAQIDGVWHGGVANLGIRPMFEGKQPLFEPHFFGFNGNLYGRKLKVELLHFLRDEAVYKDMETLMAQIHRDVEDAQAWYRKVKA